MKLDGTLKTGKLKDCKVRLPKWYLDENLASYSENEYQVQSLLQMISFKERNM